MDHRGVQDSRASRGNVTKDAFQNASKSGGRMMAARLASKFRPFITVGEPPTSPRAIPFPWCISTSAG
jgi:hypothetical protein